MELNRTEKEGHIVKLSKWDEDCFIIPIVIIRKKDGSIKLALDSKFLSDQIFKNKYQMPNIYELIDNIALQLSNKNSGEVLFSNLDLKNAYSQLKLCTDTSKQCNFSTVGAETPGTYRFLRLDFFIYFFSSKFLNAKEMSQFWYLSLWVEFIQNSLNCSIKDWKSPQKRREKLRRSNQHNDRAKKNRKIITLWLIEAIWFTRVLLSSGFLRLDFDMINAKPSRYMFKVFANFSLWFCLDSV